MARFCLCFYMHFLCLSGGILTTDRPAEDPQTRTSILIYNVNLDHLCNDITFSPFLLFKYIFEMNPTSLSACLIFPPVCFLFSRRIIPFYTFVQIEALFYVQPTKIDNLCRETCIFSFNVIKKATVFGAGLEGCEISIGRWYSRNTLSSVTWMIKDVFSFVLEILFFIHPPLDYIPS